MEDLSKKAKNYFETGFISETLGFFDVASTNYFKALAAASDFFLSKKNLIPKNHIERFEMLKKENFVLYKLISSLFLTYRKAYSKEISLVELDQLKEKVKEALKNVGIELSTEQEIRKNLEDKFKK